MEGMLYILTNSVQTISVGQQEQITPDSRGGKAEGVGFKEEFEGQRSLQELSRAEL